MQASALGKANAFSNLSSMLGVGTQAKLDIPVSEILLDCVNEILLGTGNHLDSPVLKLPGVVINTWVSVYRSRRILELYEFTKVLLNLLFRVRRRN